MANWSGGGNTPVILYRYLLRQFLNFPSFSLQSLKSGSMSFMLLGRDYSIRRRSEYKTFFLNPHSSIFRENWRLLKHY